MNEWKNEISNNNTTRHRTFAITAFVWQYIKFIFSAANKVRCSLGVFALVVYCPLFRTMPKIMERTVSVWRNQCAFCAPCFDWRQWHQLLITAEWIRCFFRSCKYKLWVERIEKLVKHCKTHLQECEFLLGPQSSHLGDGRIYSVLDVWASLHVGSFLPSLRFYVLVMFQLRYRQIVVNVGASASAVQHISRSTWGICVRRAFRLGGTMAIASVAATMFAIRLAHILTEPKNCRAVYV